MREHDQGSLDSNNHPPSDSVIDSSLSTFRVRIENFLLGPNPPAGMNYTRLGYLTYMYRSTTEDEEPVEVTREGNFWRIHDGRHRFIGSLIAGRPDVLCVEVVL